MTSALNWEDLRYFLAVCQKGSVVAAAKSLGANHSTVLRRLGSLEDNLAVRLFDRLPSGYSLTSEGHELSNALQGVGEQIETAQQRLSGKDLALDGVIRLTSTDTVISTILVPYLAQFRERHPQIQIQLVLNNNFLNLTQREADIAVRASNHPPENLIGRVVGKIQTALYASRSYLDSLGKNHGEADYRWVALDDSLAHLDSMKWFRKNVSPGKVVFRVDSFTGMVEAVSAGMGVGMLLCPLANARNELVRLAAPPPQLDTKVWLLTHPDLKQVARIRALNDFLYDCLSRDERIAHDMISQV